MVGKNENVATTMMDGSSDFVDRSLPRYSCISTVVEKAAILATIRE
jgi:hypothetical protein